MELPVSSPASLAIGTARPTIPRGNVAFAAALTACGIAAGTAGLMQRGAAPATHGHEAPLAMTVGASLRPTAQIVSSDALSHVAGKRITTMVVEFPPSGFSPPHHHGGSVSVYVLEGAIRSQLAGEPPAVYRPGETFFEPLGATHLVAENFSATQPARILAVFVADEGATLTTYHE